MAPDDDQQVISAFQEHLQDRLFEIENKVDSSVALLSGGAFTVSLAIVPMLDSPLGLRWALVTAWASWASCLLVDLLTLGQPQRALHLFDEFKALRGVEFEKLDSSSRPHHEPIYGPLKSWFEMYSDDQRDTRTLEEVMETAFDDGMVRHQDAERIAEFSSDDLVLYFSTHDQASLTTKIKELSKAPNMRLRDIALETAETIAATSELNRFRMQGMGLLKADAT